MMPLRLLIHPKRRNRSVGAADVTETKRQVVGRRDQAREASNLREHSIHLRTLLKQRYRSTGLEATALRTEEFRLLTMNITQHVGSRASRRRS